MADIIEAMARAIRKNAIVPPERVNQMAQAALRAALEAAEPDYDGDYERVDARLYRAAYPDREDGNG